MTTAAVTTSMRILRVYEPRGEVSLRFVALLLSNLHDMERRAIDLQRTTNRADPRARQDLVIRQIREGSLLIELAQSALAPGGALTVLIIAHVLTKGPENLYKWARLPNDLRAEWYASRKAMKEARRLSRSDNEKDVARIASEEGSDVVTHTIDGRTFETRYIEALNSQIAELEKSSRNIQGLSEDLEVKLIDERGETIKNPFETRY